MMARFHQYSFGNIMLIASQRPDATHVAGFQGWKKLGRFVRKGEKGIVIIAPMLLKKKDDEPRDDGDDTFLRFKAAYVFDVSQTDGEPLPEIARVSGEPNGHTDRLKAFIAEQGIQLEYAETLDGPLGRSRGGTIEIVDNLPAAEEFEVLVHELAHEMLHAGEHRKAGTRTTRETEAEAVAFVVCQAIGLEASTAAQDYIQLYEGDKGTLAAALDRIQHTAAAVIEAIKVEP